MLTLGPVVAWALIGLLLGLLGWVLADPPMWRSSETYYEYRLRRTAWRQSLFFALVPLLLVTLVLVVSVTR